MSPLQAQLHTMARYHAWATARLLAAVAALDDADYRRDTGLFFRSVHGTLNHLIVGELDLWWRRFDEGVSPRVALDAEVETDRARVAERLQAGAERWAGFVASLDDAQLGGTLTYTTMRGTPASLPYAATLAHVFNHATHHRGQVSAGLTRLGRPAPEMDLVFMLQSESPVR